MGRCLIPRISFRRRELRRGEVYLANYSFPGEVKNDISEKESNIRYVVVVQGGPQFRNCPTVVVMNMTTQGLDSVGNYPTDVFVGPAESGTKRGAKIKADQPHTISKESLIEHKYTLGSETLRKVDGAIAFSMGLAA
jgi:mRNA-degrading endonuclease toxin of MazEF toxin-antitoxin module